MTEAPTDALYRLDYFSGCCKFVLVKNDEERRHEFGTLLEALSFASRVTQGFVPLFEVNEVGKTVEVGAIDVRR